MVPLGQVNGALGETAASAQRQEDRDRRRRRRAPSILAHVPAETGLGQVLALLTPAVGLSPFAMPVLLGLSAWGTCSASLKSGDKERRLRPRITKNSGYVGSSRTGPGIA